jgi:hypothetical protein
MVVGGLVGLGDQKAYRVNIIAGRLLWGKTTSWGGEKISVNISLSAKIITQQ